MLANQLAQCHTHEEMVLTREELLNDREDYLVGVQITQDEAQGERTHDRAVGGRKDQEEGQRRSAESIMKEQERRGEEERRGVFHVRCAHL